MNNKLCAVCLAPLTEQEQLEGVCTPCADEYDSEPKRKPRKKKDDAEWRKQG